MKTPLTPFVCILLLALASPALAQSFQGAQGDVEQRLERSLRELAQLRDRIAKEKIPLSREIADLENEVLQLRRQNERLFKARDSREIALTKLRKQVDSLADQDDFIQSRLNEFARDLEGRLHISELPRYEDLIAKAKQAEKNADLDLGEKREVQLQVVASALERLQAQLGGEVFAGEALSPEGLLTQGQFVLMGPSVYYASQDGEVTGLAESQINAADPVVVDLPGGLARGIAKIAETGQGELPFDATLGKALKKERARKTLGQYVREGGVVGYVILVLGAVALALTLFKAFEIMAFKAAAPEQVDDILGELARGDAQAAARKAQQVRGAAGEMLTTGVEHAHQKRGVLEELLFEKILKVRPSLERFLPFLAITAAAAPLLGLLGTVSGMIETFQLITIFGTGDAKSLSSGISEALVTTAMGLIVAIPTLILHGALARMAKRKLTLLEQLSVAFVNGVAALREPREAA
jgi:biopolymer transport protein ExbB